MIPEVDRGEPVIVRTIPLSADESLEQLEERMHHVEHELIVLGIKAMLQRAAGSAS